MVLSLGCVIPFIDNAFASNNEDWTKDIEKQCSLKLSPKNIFDIDGFFLEPFGENEKNRNHYGDRGEDSNIDLLVMHYTACPLKETLDIFTADKKEGRVSATYGITQPEPEGKIPGGKVIQVVLEEFSAWHAGVSTWQGLNGLNPKSIGFEFINPGFTQSDKGLRTWYPFDRDQITTGFNLIQRIVLKYNINPTCVVGHSDIAKPLGRKQDPGSLFPWGTLYTSYGVGAWLTPDEQQSTEAINQYLPKEKLPLGVSVEFMTTYLNRYGYGIEPTSCLDENTSAAIQAFQWHFSKNQKIQDFKGKPNQQDMHWVWALVTKYQKDLKSF